MGVHLIRKLHFKYILLYLLMFIYTSTLSVWIGTKLVKVMRSFKRIQGSVKPRGLEKMREFR